MGMYTAIHFYSEIEKFVAWIMPYCAKYDGDFLGFYRYEEDEDPTIVKYTEVADPVDSTDAHANTSSHSELAQGRATKGE